MNISGANIKERIIRIPLLRRSGRAIWEFSRTFPRYMPFQQIPALQRWSGRPISYHRHVCDYLDLHPGRGWQRVIQPGGSYERVRPISAGPSLPPCFDPPQTVTWDDERIIFLERIRYWGGYGGSIIAHDEHLIGELSPDVWGVDRHAIFNKLKLPPLQPLPGLSAVISTPEADKNYGHWLMDLLPRLELLNRAGYGPDRIDRYLINLSGADHERESLALAGIPAEKLLPVSAASHFLCEQIVTTSIRPKHFQFCMPAWVPPYLCQLFSARRESPQTRRVYISRNKWAFRHVLNEKELCVVLNDYGFEILDSGAISVKEQAALFAGAEAIISPSGAALTNLIFSAPGTKVLELFPPDFFDVSFWTAATTAGCRYHALLGERSTRSGARTMIEARRQDLHVPLAAFRAAVAFLVGDRQE